MSNREIIRVADIATKIGKKEEHVTLPNGRVARQINWRGEDLKYIAGLLHNAGFKSNDVVDIDGPMPVWLALALTHEVHPASVRINSPDGFIPVGCNPPMGEGKGVNIKFKFATSPDDWIVLEITAVDPAVPFSPVDLAELTPPEVEMGAKVILSGRMPLWMTTSIGMAYHGRAKAVACLQPGVGATVAWTHSIDIELGSVIKTP